MHPWTRNLSKNTNQSENWVFGIYGLACEQFSEQLQAIFSDFQQFCLILENIACNCAQNSQGLKIEFW